ncbi:hypothetical protein [Natrinema soli]|uniref:Uncharacterized protein n=1 Tax=Natrinema soli TaxID=1930624 RepID=A0ABD5SWS6_9EURY|nr:hypothetical protein [Natrinema soli]
MNRDNGDGGAYGRAEPWTALEEPRRGAETDPEREGFPRAATVQTDPVTGCGWVASKSF